MEKCKEISRLQILVDIPRLMHVIEFNKDSLEKLPQLEKIKNRLEKLLELKFNYAVLNYYRDGKDYISYHSDREVEAGQTVVSVSIGATRKFVLKHKWRSGVQHEFYPANGDVLILNDQAINFSYKHSVPKIANSEPRINITFRE